MMRRKSPRLAAAFVVTVAAGCGDSRPPVVPEDGRLRTDITKNADGTCTETIHANPPSSRDVDCPPDLAGPSDPTGEGLKAAPEGWRVEVNEDGSCTAYGPDPCQHE